MGKWFKRIIKIIVIVLCLLMVWRVWLLTDDSVFSDLVPTADTAALYKADGELTVLTNDIVHEMSVGGYFSAYGFYYIPETRELQITVRYNNNSVESLGDICFYAYTVDTSGEPSVAVTDEDGNSVAGVRLHEGYPIGDIIEPEIYGHKEKLLYGYDKLIFRGVSIDENTNVIISLCTDNNSDNEKAVIAAHFAEQPFDNYKMSKAEKKAFSEYK